jgi:hypothetical protein
VAQFVTRAAHASRRKTKGQPSGNIKWGVYFGSSFVGRRTPPLELSVLYLVSSFPAGHYDWVTAQKIIRPSLAARLFLEGDA